LSHPQVFSHAPLDNEPGFPLAFHLAARLLHLNVPVESLSLHPIAVAGWVGMFATAMNLLPGGQLDGGHILFSVFPKLHRWVSLALIFALIPLAKYCWIGWLIWAVVLWLTSQHPPIPRYPGISTARKWLAAGAVAMLVLAFTPTPITGKQLCSPLAASQIDIAVFGWSYDPREQPILRTFISLLCDRRQSHQLRPPRRA
jgi:hypothetical protein